MHLTVERPALAAALKLATTAAGKIAEVLRSGGRGMTHRNTNDLTDEQRARARELRNTWAKARGFDRPKGHCNEGDKGISVAWPCPTLRILDGGVES